MADTENTNPGNFANRPREEVRDIAAKGGHASQRGRTTSATGDNPNTGDVSNEGRNPDGTFTKGSEAAKEAGAKGGSK